MMWYDRHMNVKPGDVVTLEHKTDPGRMGQMWASTERRLAGHNLRGYQCSGPTFDVQPGISCIVASVIEHPIDHESLLELVFSSGRIGFFSTTTGVVKSCSN